MENKLTDRDVWAAYWKNYQFRPIEKHTFFARYIPRVARESSFIEIGGFPGLNAAYFYKYVCNKVALVDFYINPEVIAKVEAQNNMPQGSIETFESDFFLFTSARKYDVVFSLGFIEHFHDTADVIARHANLLSERGKLLIILPNLRGLNGAVQYLFDRKNLRIHNLKSMDIVRLRNIAQQLGLKDVRVEYTSKPMVWLEPKPGICNRIARIFVKGVSYFVKLFPLKCKLLSPYIVISASK